MSTLLTGLIPKIEGFQPIPNAVMIPFMEVQSAALAYGFGLNYEFSKRKIRSMSNEEYNKLTPQDIEEMQARHTAVLLEGFIKRVPAVMPAQAQIFDQYVKIEMAKVEKNVELARWMIKFAKETLDDELAHAMGGHLHPTDSVKPSNQQTYFDPNDPTKDFAPPPKPQDTADFPPSGQPKTNIPEIKPNAKFTFKVLVSSNRPAGDSLTKTAPQWGSWLVQMRAGLSGKQNFYKQNEKRIVADIFNVSFSLHEKTGKWY